MVQTHLDAGRHYIDDVRLLDHKWCERIWTPVATCVQQGREVFPFLLDSVQSHLGGASSSGRHHRGRYGREVFPFLSCSTRCKLIWAVQAHLDGASSSGQCKLIWTVLHRGRCCRQAPSGIPRSLPFGCPPWSPRRPRERLQNTEPLKNAFFSGSSGFSPFGR